MALTGDALLEDALFRHLATLTITPATVFAWPGRPEVGTKPRVEVAHAPNTAQASDLQDGKDNPGFLVLTVVYEEGFGTIKPREIASQIADHFEGLTLHTTEHRIRFIQPATTGQAFPDGSEIRLPVTVPYLATS